MPEFLFDPRFWIAFWIVGILLAAYVVWCFIADTLRKIDEAETEIDRSPHMSKVGSVYVIHPDRDFYGRGGDAA